MCTKAQSTGWAFVLTGWLDERRTVYPCTARIASTIAACANGFHCTRASASHSARAEAPFHARERADCIHDRATDRSAAPYTPDSSRAIVQSRPRSNPCTCRERIAPGDRIAFACPRASALPQRAGGRHWTFERSSSSPYRGLSPAARPNPSSQPAVAQHAGGRGRIAPRIFCWADVTNAHAHQSVRPSRANAAALATEPA
jgi:hypothetical protein